MTDPLSRLASALSDRYTIERELGSGGMATVYLAEDLKLHRKVALKVLRPELASALGPDRFLQEIDIAAKLNHPHILGLFDCGEADGSLYYVMPYVEGESLRDRLAKEGELPIAQAVRILRDVVDALKHAHKHNVVHRDIKPDNVMLAENHALVTDFGVAKAVSDATGAIGLTTEGVALGTPAYMAPEQAAADPHIDHRADIYAVGVIAYELLTGRTPFVGNTQQELLAAHVTQAPDPVTKYRESVPPGLGELVMKCLEKKAADRWQSAEELLPQLEALATPSGGTTPTGAVASDRVVKRRWMMVVGAMGVAAVIALIVVFAAIPRGRGIELNPEHVVVAQFRNQTGDPSFDQLGARIGHWITQGVQQAAIPVTPWDQALQSWEYVQAEAVAGRARDPIRALAEETGAGIVVSGSVYLVEADSLEIQLNVTDAALGRLIGTVAPLRAPRASATQLIGDAQQRVMGFLAVRFEQRLGDWAPGVITPPPSFEAYQAFSEGLRQHYRREYAEAARNLRRAHELDSTWAQPLIVLHSVLLNLVASGDIARRDEADSVLVLLEPYREALTPYEQAWIQSRRARQEGDLEQLLPAIRRAAELAPGGTPAVYNHALYLTEIYNRPREALAVLSTLNPERGWVRKLPAYFSVKVYTLLALGEMERALEEAQRAQRLHPDEAVYLLRLQAHALASLGRLGELRVVLDEIGTAADAVVGRCNLVPIVETLRVFRHMDASREIAERAVSCLEATPPNQVDSTRHKEQLGRALFLAGRREEAQEVFDSLVDASPGRLNMRATRAFIAAIHGDTARALSDQEWFLERDEDTRWQRAIIAGALGDHDRAMSLLRDAGPMASRLFMFYWPSRNTFLYDPLRDHPEFQELMRPKG